MLNIQFGGFKKIARAFIFGFFFSAPLIATVNSGKEEEELSADFIAPQLTTLPAEMLALILTNIDSKTLRALRTEHSNFNAYYESRQEVDIKIDGGDVDKFIGVIRSRRPFKILNSLTLTGDWQGRGKDESLHAILRPIKRLNGLVLDGVRLTLEDAQYLSVLTPRNLKSLTMEAALVKTPGDPFDDKHLSNDNTFRAKRIATLYFDKASRE